MLLDVTRTMKWIAALEANEEHRITGALYDHAGGMCALGCIGRVDEDINQLCPKFLTHMVNLNDGMNYWTENHINPHRTREHTFAEIANILKIRLRAQMEFLNSDGTKKQTVLPVLEITGVK